MRCSSPPPITCTRRSRLAAMDLGKHVYVQKPLTWSVDEARQLSKRAKETKVATQMGNQGHSLDDARTAVEYVQAGAIGDVREVHIWTNRPLGYWPQGVPRPEPLKTMRAKRSDGAAATSDTRLAANASPETIRCRTRSTGICFSASRRTFRITRSIIRSTGAAGWIGASARSATWART